MEMHGFGDCVKQSYAEAEQMYLAAAEAGSGDAMMRIGRFYTLADSGFMDTEKAKYWFGMAAQYGFVDGLIELAILSFDDPVLANDLLEQASQYGDDALKQKAREAAQFIRDMRRGYGLPDNPGI